MFNLIGVILVVFFLFGCSESAENPTKAPSEKNISENSKPSQMLAYEHTLSMDVPETQVSILYNMTQSLCNSNDCVILESNLDRGEEFRGTLKIRAKPEKIQDIIKILGSKGDVVNHTVRGEDLAVPISDSEKKLSMLKEYRSSLEALQKRQNVSIDSIIKINQQLAQVQSEIETLSGEKAHLELRVKTEVLNVYIISENNRSFLAPIKHTITEFKSTFSTGISVLISIIAFLLPFAVFLWFIRMGWRKLKLMNK